MKINNFELSLQEKASLRRSWTISGKQEEEGT